MQQPVNPHDGNQLTLLLHILPFKIPIPGYSGEGYGCSLGVRRSGGRQPLQEERALVLISLPKLSEQEKLKEDSLQLQVAELREGIYCMYDSVLGTRIEN